MKRMLHHQKDPRLEGSSKYLNGSVKDLRNVNSEGPSWGLSGGEGVLLAHYCRKRWTVKKW